MKPSKQTQFLILMALLSFGAAFALDRYIANRFYSIDFDPVRKPVNVQEGFSLTEAFTVDYESNYEVGLLCKRALPRHLLNGILQSNLNLTYSVFENDNLLVQVDSTNLLWGRSTSKDSITRMLGDFPASPGKEYRIDFYVRSSIPELKATDPMLTVGLDYIVRKTDFYARAMPFALAKLALGVLGISFLLSILISQLQNWIRKRKSTEQVGCVQP